MRSEKTHKAVVRVHAALTTVKKLNWQILNTGPNRVEKLFSKYGHAKQIFKKNPWPKTK